MRFILAILFVAFLSFQGDKSDWIMYPNPARDHFFVEVKDGTLQRYLRIYDMQGRLLQTEYIGSEQKIVRIDVDLPSGMYVVKMEDR